MRIFSIIIQDRVKKIIDTDATLKSFVLAYQPILTIVFGKPLLDPKDRQTHSCMYEGVITDPGSREWRNEVTPTTDCQSYFT